MKNPNLNRIIAENLEKDKFQSKYKPSLPTDSWLNQYRNGGQPCYECGGNIYKEGGEADPTKPYHPITNPDGYRPSNQLERIQKLSNKEKPYQPSQAVNNAKAILAGVDVGTGFSANPYALATNFLARLANSTGDAYTAARYAMDGQWSNAGVDAGEAILDLIPFRKGKKVINLSKTNNLPGTYNKLSKLDKSLNNGLKAAKAGATADDFMHSTLGKFLFGDPDSQLQYKKGGGYFPEYHSWAPPRHANGGDISIPDLNPDTWLLKYKGGGPGDGIGGFFRGIFGGKGGRGSVACPGPVCGPGDIGGGGGLHLGEFFGKVGHGIGDFFSHLPPLNFHFNLPHIGGLGWGKHGRVRKRRCIDAGMTWDEQTQTCRPTDIVINIPGDSGSSSGYTPSSTQPVVNTTTTMMPTDGQPGPNVPPDIVFNYRSPEGNTPENLRADGELYNGVPGGVNDAMASTAKYGGEQWIDKYKPGGVTLQTTLPPNVYVANNNAVNKNQSVKTFDPTNTSFASTMRFANMARDAQSKKAPENKAEIKKQVAAIKKYAATLPKTTVETTINPNFKFNIPIINDSNSGLIRQQKMLGDYYNNEYNRTKASIDNYRKSNPWAANLNDNDIVQRLQMTNQSLQNQGTLKVAQPEEGILSRAWNIASNPMTALSYKIKGQDIPLHFERGEKNILDHAVNIINPATYINSGASIGNAVLNPWETTKTLTKGAINLTTNLAGDGNVFNDGSNSKALGLLGDVGNMFMLGETGAFRPLKGIYNDVATGNSVLPVAWKSPAVGLTEEASQNMFKNVLNNANLTDAERAVIADYQSNSRLFTGRNGNIDPVKRQAINDIIKKYNINVGDDAIATRMFNPENNSLGATLDKGRLNFGDRPTSFTVGAKGTYGSGAVDRLVIPNRYLKGLGNKFVKNTYEPLSEEALKLVPENSREFAAGIGRDGSRLGQERELVGSGLDFQRVGKVKNDVGGYDWIVQPRNSFGNRMLLGHPEFADVHTAGFSGRDLLDKFNEWRGKFESIRKPGTSYISKMDFSPKQMVTEAPAVQKPVVQFNGSKLKSFDHIEDPYQRALTAHEYYQDQLNALRARGQEWDKSLGNTHGADLLHPDMIEYHGTFSGRPLVEVKMPDGTSEHFYKSTGWAGKSGAGADGTTNGQWQIFGQHMNAPAGVVTDSPVPGWFIKGHDYNTFYGSKTFEQMANGLDNALMKKFNINNNVDELNNAINFQGKMSPNNSYTPPVHKHGGSTNSWIRKYDEGGQPMEQPMVVTTETTRPPAGMGAAGPIMPINLIPPLIKGFNAVKEFFTSEPEVKPTSTLEETLHFNLNDPRTMRMTTGSKMNPNRDLVRGEYVLNDIKKMIKEAKKRGLSLDDVYNLSAIDLQETGWGKTDDNMGHVLNYKGKDPIDGFLNAYQDKMKTANRLKYTDPYLRLQVYNGLGKVYPTTEQWYHGFKANSFYGVPVPKTGLDLKKNPLYGKQIVDLRDNVLKKNPEFVKFITETYNSKKMGGQINWTNKYK